MFFNLKYFSVVWVVSVRSLVWYEVFLIVRLQGPPGPLGLKGDKVRNIVIDNLN